MIKIPSRKVSVSWLVKMAWRDSRRNRGKLSLFVLSIIIALASLVGINSFKENMKDEIDSKAMELLGADLEVSTRQAWTEEQQSLLDSLKGEEAYQTLFASMVYFPRSIATRLVQVRALTGDYPFYGSIETEPAWAARDLPNGNYALVDEKLMMQFDVELGDDVKIGETNFKITGKLRSIPGQSGMSTTISPVVYIPGRTLEATGLIKKGSRVTRSIFYKLDSPENLTAFLEEKKARLEELNIRYDTIDEKKEDTTRAFENLTTFLNLATFIALLLGSIGVASAVFIYLKDKKELVAILRCLGVKGKEAFLIYLIQVISMGFIGSAAGCLLGIGMQYYLPQLLADMLPVQLTPTFYWEVPLIGMALGMTITFLFGLAPLLSLRSVSPLLSIRESFSHESKKTKAYDWLIYGLLIIMLYGFSYFQMREWLQALYFVLGLGVAFAALFGLSLVLMIAAKKMSKAGWSYTLRQGIANLHRPNNQTTILVLTIGLCVTLFTTIMLARTSILEQMKLAGADERPNMVVFDIQTHQKEEVKTVTLDYDLPVLQDVPIVTMRLLEVNGISKKEAEKDSTFEFPDWAYNREYRVTFRDSLIASEEVTQGKLQKKVGPNDSIFVSMAEGFSESLKINIGDELLWNVQGAIFKTYVGSFRKIDWRRVQTNFLVLFPTGVLEQAPQFHVLVTKATDQGVSAKYQQAMVRFFPNVSIIDLELILETVEEVLGQISYVINFMALITLLTCAAVLIGSIVISKGNRIKESVLLKTIGAQSHMVLKITLIEYLALGAVATLSGLILANILGYLLLEYVMETVYIFDWVAIFAVAVSMTLGTTLIGLSNIRTILRKSPLEVLRSAY